MPRTSLDPDRVAYCEAEGWRAYYEHDWPRLLRLVVEINRQEFHMPLPAALLAAYYTVQASRAWAPPTDGERAHYFLRRFYRQALAHSEFRFDPAEAAEREIEYWEVHRKQRGGGQHEEYLRTLTALHSTIFGIDSDQARESAEHRTAACELVVDITDGKVIDLEAGWARLTDDLRECYRSVVREIGAT